MENEHTAAGRSWRVAQGRDCLPDFECAWAAAAQHAPHPADRAEFMRGVMLQGADYAADRMTAGPVLRVREAGQ